MKGKISKYTNVKKRQNNKHNRNSDITSIFVLLRTIAESKRNVEIVPRKRTELVSIANSPIALGWKTRV